MKLTNNHKQEVSHTNSIKPVLYQNIKTYKKEKHVKRDVCKKD